MNVSESIILYCTALVSLGGLVFSLLSYRLENDNRRNAMREMVFSKQLDLYLELNKLIVLIEDNFNSMITPDSNENHLMDSTLNLIDELDITFSKSEIIVPDALYIKVSKLIEYFYKTWGKIKNKVIIPDEEFTRNLSDENIKLILELSDFMGIEQLSDENNRLASRAQLNKTKSNSKSAQTDPF